MIASQAELTLNSLLPPRPRIGGGSRVQRWLRQQGALPAHGLQRMRRVRQLRPGGLHVNQSWLAV